MRFRTRAFLLCFVPSAVLLSVSFWLIARQVQATVRGSIRSSLGANQRAFARMRSSHELQNSRFLRVAGENSALKAGVQLLLSDRNSEAARSTLEDQLREMCGQMGFDLLVVSAPDGTPLASVRRETDGLKTLNVASEVPLKGRIALTGGRVAEVASVPIDAGYENIGSLSVGQYLDLSLFTVPTLLMHANEVVASNLRDVSLPQLKTALAHCGDSECDSEIAGDSYVSLPMRELGQSGDALTLRSIENVDRAVAPTMAVLRSLFLSVAAAAVLMALFCGIAAARTITGPLATVIAKLREAAHTGVLPEFDVSASQIREISDLTESFNRAAVKVHEAQNGLQRAYVEFTGSLANALDARDGYTAGHSERVSHLSCATAKALGLRSSEAERTRIGALLHDIGKIGIADGVLQKPGRLTDEEFAIVKQHPGIGRRILEGVQGLAPFLQAVELHHENWDGTGYPHGQKGLETPIEARIIHVADAYDAMTTDRPYRRGMSHQRALAILRDCAGTQFDPAVVAAFTSLPEWYQREPIEQSGAVPSESELAAV